MYLTLGVGSSWAEVVAQTDQHFHGLQRVSMGSKCLNPVSEVQTRTSIHKVEQSSAVMQPRYHEGHQDTPANEQEQDRRKDVRMFAEAVGLGFNRVLQSDCHLPV
jgi:hypothetical protein